MRQSLSLRLRRIQLPLHKGAECRRENGGGRARIARRPKRPSLSATGDWMAELMRSEASSRPYGPATKRMRSLGPFLGKAHLYTHIIYTRVVFVRNDAGICRFPVLIIDKKTKDRRRGQKTATSLAKLHKKIT